MEDIFHVLRGFQLQSNKIYEFITCDFGVGGPQRGVYMCENEHLPVSYIILNGKMSTIKSQTSTNIHTVILQQAFIKCIAIFDNLKHLMNPKLFGTNVKMLIYCS